MANSVFIVRVGLIAAKLSYANSELPPNHLKFPVSASSNSDRQTPYPLPVFDTLKSRLSNRYNSTFPDNAFFIRFTVSLSFPHPYTFARTLFFFPLDFYFSLSLPLFNYSNRRVVPHFSILLPSLSYTI